MIFEAADLVVRVSTREVWWCGQPVTLQPRPFDLLVYLIEHRHRVVAKSELMATVWSGDKVVPDALTTAMHNVRRALGERGRSPRYIRTVHRLGYQWVAPVEARASAIRLLVRAGRDKTVRLEPVDALPARFGRSRTVTFSGAAGESIVAMLAERLGCEHDFDAVCERIASHPIVISIEATGAVSVSTSRAS